MKNKRIIGLVIVVLLAYISTSCYYDEVLPITVDAIAEQVSFSGDIMPIFDASCNVSGCHNTGGQVPDLTAANAYSQLNTLNYINTGSPETSELYQWMLGNEALPMPVSGTNAEYNALVLAWITQGALDN